MGLSPRTTLSSQPGPGYCPSERTQKRSPSASSQKQARELLSTRKLFCRPSPLIDVNAQKGSALLQENVAHWKEELADDPAVFVGASPGSAAAWGAASGALAGGGAAQGAPAAPEGGAHVGLSPRTSLSSHPGPGYCPSERTQKRSPSVSSQKQARELLSTRKLFCRPSPLIDVNAQKGLALLQENVAHWKEEPGGGSAMVVSVPSSAAAWGAVSVAPAVAGTSLGGADVPGDGAHVGLSSRTVLSSQPGPGYCPSERTQNWSPGASWQKQARELFSTRKLVCRPSPLIVVNAQNGSALPQENVAQSWAGSAVASDAAPDALASDEFTGCAPAALGRQSAARKKIRVLSVGTKAYSAF